MDGLCLLVGLSFLPVSAGRYTAAVTAVRDAAFIQSGLKSDWDALAAASRRRVPKPVADAAAVGYAAYRREAVIRTRDYGTYTVSPGKFSAGFSFGF